MEKNNHISALWPTLIGEFYNSEHEKMKSDLLNYFDDYMKNNPPRKSGENYKLYESKYNLHTESNEHFKKLITFIAKCVLTMSNEANKKEILAFRAPRSQIYMF